MYSVNTTQNSLFLAVLFKVPLFLKSRLEILGASLQLLHPQLLHPVACQMMLIFISMIPWHHAVLVLTHLTLPIFRLYYELLRDCCFSLVVQLLNRVWLFRPHGLQHARLPSPSPSPRVCSNSCPLSRRCHPTISSSVIPFFLQSFPASGLFQCIGSSHQVASVFQWIFRIDFV